MKFVYFVYLITNYIYEQQLLRGMKLLIIVILSFVVKVLIASKRPLQAQLEFGFL